MRYLVVSDSHGYNNNLKRVIDKEKGIEGMFHLGDLQCSPDEIEQITGCNVIAIAGNNDFRMDLKPMRTITRKGHRILMVHGHRQHVGFGGFDRLVYTAMENEADIVMFGHTHVPFYEVINGITVVNPGSISLPRQSNKKPTYMIMDINAEGLVDFVLKELD